ncbi:MAG: hypothetical protein KF746_21175 [Chitinophagaceae bacterium]|nr:hypothetical protein [Chitinophagaceae bacterium]
MGDNIFNYILEITGLDNRIHSDANGNPVPHVEFREANYFITLCEAVDSLLLIDIRKFEKLSEEANNDRYCECAIIRAIEDNEPLVEIFRLSIEDTPKGCPEAGIYMGFFETRTRQFERLTDYDLSRFSAYDPDLPFLQLASYAYDKGFKISVDEELTHWVNDLKSYDPSSVEEVEWDYQVSITRNSFSSPALQETTNYHYPWLQEAFIHLLGTDIRKVGKQIAEGSNNRSWIEDASLSERGAKKIVEIIAVKDHISGEADTQPGIYLKLYTSIENIEGESGIGLAQLGNYDQDAKYLLVANYYDGFNKLLQHPGYLSLLLVLNAEQALRQQSAKQGPYQLQITWISSQNLNEDINYPQQQVAQITYSSLDEALFSLKELDERLFDEKQALHLRYPIYVKQADIIDISNKSVVVSKFQVRQENDQSPAAMYLRVNEEHASEKMLKSLRALVVETTQARLQQSSTTGEKTSQQFSSQDDPKQIHRSPRKRIPPEDKGLGL